MRHAKAEQVGPSDFERALSGRGVADAVAGGGWLAELGISPDLALVSAALRTRQTWEAVADGASWLRCDSGFPSNFASTDMQRVDFTHKNAAQDHAEQLQACLDRPPTVNDQPLVACAAPHAYESTGRVAALTGLSAFPSADQLRRAERQCRVGLPPEQSSPDFETVASWDAKEQVQSGRYFGVCFVHRTDGSPMD